MSRHYITISGAERLAFIECDSCSRIARPGSPELLNEWRKYGRLGIDDFGRRINDTNYACGLCAQTLEVGV